MRGEKDGVDEFNRFRKLYWNYFLELEHEFAETSRYVSFEKSNSNTYSREFLKLLQAICSEIDVVGKEIASIVDPTFNSNGKQTIKNWGYALQKQFHLKDYTACFLEDLSLDPWKDWEYEARPSKAGAVNLAVVGGKPTISWWKDYNSVKHQRTAIVEGTSNFAKANLGNVILALAALFIMETVFLNWLVEKCGVEQNCGKSTLFVLNCSAHI